MDPEEVFRTVRELLTAAVLDVAEGDGVPLDLLDPDPVARSLALLIASFVVFTAVDSGVSVQWALGQLLVGYDYEVAKRILGGDELG